MVESGDIKKYVWKNAGHQYFAVITGNVVNLLIGAIQAWITPVLPLLMSDDTPLVSGPMNSAQISWLASSGSIGSLLGNFVFGAITSMSGCKRSTAWLTLPCVLFWLFIYFGNTYEYVVIGRWIGGIAGGGLLPTIYLYTAEVANDEIRGQLGSLPMISRNIGMLMVFIVGSTLSYQYTPCVFVFIPIVSGIIYITLPNTPQYYLERNQNQEAENALKYYKGFKGESLEERRAFSTELQRLSDVMNQRKSAEKFRFRNLYNWNASKGIIICMIISVIRIGTGNFALLNYSMLIFARAGADINPYYATIMLFIGQTIGCFCSAGLADRLGRKLMIIVSLVGSAFGLITIAVYLYLTEIGVETQSFTWIPVVSLSLAIFIGSAGILALGSIFTIEQMPTKVRDFGLFLSNIVLSIASFISVKSFPLWMEEYGLPVALGIYAVFSLAGALFIMHFTKETKGQSIDYVN